VDTLENVQKETTSPPARTVDNKEATFFLNTVDTHRNQRKGGSQMKIYKVQDFVVKGKEVFVGLEDSKSTWKIAVRRERMLIHAVCSGPDAAPASAPSIKNLSGRERSLLSSQVVNSLGV
jgi:hypothetical protein